MPILAGDFRVCSTPGDEPLYLDCCQIPEVGFGVATHRSRYAVQNEFRPTSVGLDGKDLLPLVKEDNEDGLEVGLPD